MARRSHPNRKEEPKARKSYGERKVRHQSQGEKLRALQRVRGGKMLDDNDDDLDERSWMDW